MKVLYSSIYRDGAGYSYAALENIMALDTVGIDVVCRPISLARESHNMSNDKIKELESKSLDNIDAVIQHIPADYFECKKGVKSIGMLEWETQKIPAHWVERCNMMDQIWVPCEHNKWACENAGVTVPVVVLPHACDVKKYDYTGRLDWDVLKNKCVFYTISEFSRRKNFSALLRAYYHAFTSEDKVCLIIKTSVDGFTDKQTTDHMKKFVSDIKKSANIFDDESKYPPVICCTKRFTDEEIMKLHNSGDVFVLPSHGEAWSMPAHDALGFGKLLIVSKHGGFVDLASKYTYQTIDGNKHPVGVVSQGYCRFIEGQYTPCFGMLHHPDHLYSGKNLWFDPSVENLSAHMTTYYQMYLENNISKYREAARSRAFQFSRENVGQIAKNILGA